MNEMREPGHAWSCKQIPNGMTPIVICERSDLLARVDSLMAENSRLHVEAAASQNAWRVLMDERDAAVAALEDDPYASDAEIVGDLTSGLLDAAARLDAVDALHQPTGGTRGVKWCAHCRKDWPCPTSQIVRPA